MAGWAGEAKERDTETGNDDFGARYYSSSLGRFMSSDSTGYSSLANPQAWNLYAYTLNNPLKYNDPSGHKVECTGSAEKCKDALAGATGNAEAAKRVTTQTTTTHHKFLFFKWDTTKTTIQISGDIASFRALGQNASRLADLVTNNKTFKFGVTESYSRAAESTTLWGTLNESHEQRINNGGVTLTTSENYKPGSYIPPDPSAQDQEAAAEGIPGANLAEAAAHEFLGHLWSEEIAGHKALPEGTPDSAINKKDAVDAENAVRATDPARGQKKKHD